MNSTPMYQSVIGLEVHVQLKTVTKAFCGCSTEFGKAPNSHTCPVCLGLPGSLPVLNEVAFDYAVKVAIALGCVIQKETKFDRKNYFYPDLPKNYQISQYDLPIALDGFLDIDLESSSKRVSIRRVHMEEDAGKLIHKDGLSLVDYNRAGMPLLEIVSQPELYSPDEAYAYLTGLKSILQYLDISDCDMEKGSLRCDANVSLKRRKDTELGVKTELKNLNSFKAVRDSLSFEIKRQSQVLENGEKVIQETRLWDEQRQLTQPMRSKEGAHDYRYFPEPDLPLFLIGEQKTRQLRAEIPELPRQKVERFIKDYSLSQYDARILAATRQDADYAERCFICYPETNKKPLVNFLIGPMAAEANARGLSLSGLSFAPDRMIELVQFVGQETISHLTAKAVLKEAIETNEAPGAIIKRKNLAQVSDSAGLEGFIGQALAENPRSVADYKQGKAAALMFLVGQVMKKSAGKANPKIVQEMMKRRLS